MIGVDSAFSRSGLLKVSVAIPFSMFSIKSDTMLLLSSPLGLSHAASKPSRRLLMIASASAMIRSINSLQVGMS